VIEMSDGNELGEQNLFVDSAMGNRQTHHGCDDFVVKVRACGIFRILVHYFCNNCGLDFKRRVQGS